MRRAGWGVVLGAVVAVAVGSRGVAQDAAPAVTVYSLNAFDIQYVLSGRGYNAVALLREDGVILIDPLPWGSGVATRQALAAVTDQEVTTIVHVREGDEFLIAGTEFPSVTQVVGRARAGARRRGPPAPPGRAGAPPGGERDTALLDGPDRIVLRPLGPGVGASDLLVLMPEKKLAYLGESFPGRRLPVVDAARGGSLAALSRAVAGVRAEVTGIRSVVPGRDVPRQGAVGTHKPQSEMPITMTSSWKDFEEYGAFLAEVVAQARSAKAAGKPPAAALALPERFKAFDLSGAGDVVAGVYAELAAP